MTLSEYILDVNEATFETEVLMRSHEVPVVVDFWAPWCAPCKIVGPMLERLTIEAGGAIRLAKVNVDDSPQLAIRFGVQGIPAIKAFRNGEVEAELVGAQPEPILRRFIKNLAPSEAEKAVGKARSLLVTRHWPEAESAFRAVLDQDDGNASAALGLVESYLMQGKGNAALQLIEHFPSGTEWATAERLRPLARLIAEVEENGPRPAEDVLESAFYQAARLIAKGNLQAAMDGLLGILRQDKQYRDGLPKQIMVALFTLLGDDDPVTREYRDELASVLF